MKDVPTGLLKSIGILSSLLPEELASLYAHMQTKTYREGETIFVEGDVGDAMYVVLEGTISITVNTQDGEPLEIAQVSAGNFFGEMSIFDSAPRSATCGAKTHAKVLSLSSDDFYHFVETKPGVGIRIMYAMLNTATERLRNTGAFLSDMVTWGEQARARAITDDFTGLYNRRFLDEAIEQHVARSLRTGRPLSVVMVDLDHFGALNEEYGQAVGDEVIKAVVPFFKSLFREEDVLARYGGDEFTLLLPDTPGERALRRCIDLVSSLRSIDLLEGRGGTIRGVTASVGIASVPDHGDTVDLVRGRADRALYVAKEQGRDRAVMWSEAMAGPPSKTRIPTIKRRNLVVQAIITAFLEREGFLVVGHQNPDEDCVSSMIAIGLLLNKLGKTAYLLFPKKLHKNFQYLVNICRYNEIAILENDQELPPGISTTIVMDTPKPSMLESFPGDDAWWSDPSTLKIEIDHHLEADSGYTGDPGYRFVDEASSASELVGLLAFKLRRREGIAEYLNPQDIFSRNFVLSVLTGIVGDSKMGKYLKTNRERWFYRLFSSMFNDMLVSQTRRRSRNFSSMREVFHELQRLSEQEDACFARFMAYERSMSRVIGIVAVSDKEMDRIRADFDHETIVTVARYTADVLAERTGRLSLVVYPDDKKTSGLVQFRMRRSQSFKELDLRTVLERFGIENGGGHPGAIGFRFPAEELPDLGGYLEELVRGTEELVNEVVAEG